MRLAGWLVGMVIWFAASVAAVAQDVWVQIEAQPTRQEGEERARAYSGVFPNVNGFALPTGWYAIALGPFDAAEADRQLRLLKQERLIPGDSYIAFSNRYRERFWPTGAAALAPAVPTAPSAATPEALSDESPAEARYSESLLAPEDRQLIQEALKWEGVYAGAIDGAFGAGTRNSMAAWQSAQGYQPTGILTTAQRATLIETFQTERTALGLEAIREEEAGIEVTLPAALVEFDRYQPPFVQYREKDGSGFRALLISQPGDERSLAGLYDMMQTLEVVPLGGERQLGRTSFVLTGKNDRVESYTQADLAGGVIRGFTLAWKPEDGAQAAKALEAMKASFRPFGSATLDETTGAGLAEDHAALMAGLEVRKPIRARSGFYVSATGLVATTDEVLAECGRVTLGSDKPAETVLRDAGLGLAVLKPREPLAPRAHARFADRPARVGAEIAVAGYSYEGALDDAVLSFGTLADLSGLQGEATKARLSVTTLAGDAGGPVLDATGGVIGMLLPRGSDAGRVLPDDVGIAIRAEAIRSALAAAGLAPAEPAAAGTPPELAPEDLTMLGRDMTVLVSCWP
ncbi:serine protease [Defluviimonas sp. WL0024]|uniref:Serine protease n=2 Tax=Albidovulum TaxID=205889 RepID=A0ABT3J320_9RHOB|nr:MULTISPECIES: serine protease [Defluviimonas]MCU9847702.1 serine protease [Defluviimonas sp. WL0024]MCW3781870.1 serine protease [Defluviimonas salinarum]